MRPGESRLQRLELAPPADDRQLIPRSASRGTASPPGRREDGDRLDLSFDRHVGQPLPGERVPGLLPHGFGDVDASGRRLGHEPRREVHRVAEADERAPHRVAVGAAAGPAVCDADLDLASLRDPVELEDLQSRRHRARGVVLVGVRGAEHRVQVGALVAEGQLEEVAAVVGEDPLRTSDEAVQLLDRVVVRVVVDPGEAHEDGDRRAELGEELAASRPEPLVYGRKEPRPHELLREWMVRLRRRRLVRRLRQPCDEGDGTAALLVGASLGHLDALAQGVERGLVEHDLPLPGQVLRRGELVDEPPCQHVDELDVRIADDEAARRSHGDGDLHRQPHRLAARGRDLPHLGHRLLHRERGRRGPRTVVSVDPARDRVAAEVDDLAAEAVELSDDRVEDPVEVAGELLRAALRAPARRRAPR